MYRRVLAAVNEHLNSEVAARYAMHLARASGAKLYLCFIASPGMPAHAVAKAEEALKDLFIEAEGLGVEVESIAETGEVAKVMATIVRKEEVDIAFVATRRADTQRRFFAGTMARRLSLGLPCSTALVRVVHMGRVHPAKILVPLKARTGWLEERAYFTAKMAEAFGSEVVLLHAPKPISKFFHGEVNLSPLQWEERLSPDIRGFVERLGGLGVAHARRLVPGGTGKAITVEAFSKRHDLIIMGASERSLLGSILRGNPLEEVLRDTPCNLIVLRPRHADTKP